MKRMIDIRKMLHRQIKMDLKFILIYLFVLTTEHARASNEVPVLNVDQKDMMYNENNDTLKFLPIIMLIDQDKDTGEFWRETDIVSLVRQKETDIDFDRCKSITQNRGSPLRIPSRRTVRPICMRPLDFQQCPQCSHLNNNTECELFRDSCRERRVHPSESRTYCDQKYGTWNTMFFAADYSQCRCCDECVFYREMDQSCMADEYSFETEEFLPVTTIDFRAGCNPYWGHPEQELRALRCDSVLRRCVPVSVPSLPNDTLNLRRRLYRFEPLKDARDCPVSCRGYQCPRDYQKEEDCTPGGFIPDKDQCNCCGKCKLDQKCAEFKKTIHNLNGAKELEVEEEFIEPGCDDGLVCREGVCQDIHTVDASASGRRGNRQEEEAYEPCKRELKYFKKKYGKDGHLHYNAPQCTPLWLYAPVQCRRFVCYCALEDGTFISGIKVPRIEVSNMNCDCAREKCRTGSDIQCDGYGNYAEAVFLAYSREENRATEAAMDEPRTTRSITRTRYDAAQPTRYTKS